jgi:3-oxoacyl-[acyl-carrier protein] reductase/meso-butanediol dehydrogenase/(S,S)-butanediol dehydrogenase/diacetyl reductase
MGLLDGHLALVTGAGRMKGIGRGICMSLAHEGADVVVHEGLRAPESFPADERAAGWQGAASVAEEIVALGRRALAVSFDVTDAPAIRAAVRQVHDGIGIPDILVNNAALAGTTGGDSLLELDDEVWRQLVDVNTTGLYLVTKAFAPGILERGGGSIVNISSIGGRFGIPTYGAYCTTKFGVIGFTQQLARELAPTVRVNCVCPGSVDTDMMRGTYSRRDLRAGTDDGTQRRIALTGVPLARQGLPHEIGDAVTFLASDRATFITGQSLNVDGGVRMD